MKNQDILDLLGIEISPARLKCALLSLDTHAARARGARWRGGHTRGTGGQGMTPTRRTHGQGVMRVSSAGHAAGS